MKKFPKSRYAVSSFDGTEFDAKEDAEIDENLYYVGARALIYQLLHAERTRFRSPDSVLVLVIKGVRDSKRERLRDDGARVFGVATWNIPISQETHWGQEYNVEASLSDM